MLSTAEVADSPPSLIDSGLLCGGPEVVDVWPVGLKIGGREKNSLRHGEDAFTNLGEVWGGGVNPRHCVRGDHDRGEDGGNSGDSGDDFSG